MNDSLAAVLTHLGVDARALLGRGGEARVYALDTERVVRVLDPGGRLDDVARRQSLVASLARATPAFALPDVLETGEVHGRVYAIERRLPGRSVLHVLAESDGSSRTRLIEVHLDAAAALGDLHLTPHEGFGELIADDAIRTSTWRAYLEQRAAANLTRSASELRAIDPIALAAPFSEPNAVAFVHLDAFAGNMLTDGERITAVLDIGVTSLAGDRRFDPLSAAVYLASPDITPTARPGDLKIAIGWLRNAGLADHLEPARRWLAAYWSAATDDTALQRFCNSVLRER